MNCLICNKNHNQATLLRVDRGSLSSEWACDAHIGEADAQQRSIKASEEAARGNELGAGNVIPA